MTRTLESVGADGVIVSDDETGAIGRLLHAFLVKGVAAFEELKRGSGGTLAPDLRVERTADEWRIISGGSRVISTTEEIEQLLGYAYDTRRMQRMETFPIGETILGGTFEITDELYGGPERGVYRGREIGSDVPLLITLSGPQSVPLPALMAKLAHRLDGITPLRYIGSLDGGNPFVAMVEVAPRGTPASTALRYPVETDLAVALVLQLAELLGTDERARIGLRPEMIFVEDGRISGVAPRAEPFWTTARSASQGVAMPFENVYLAPEVLADPFGEFSDRADVFSLAAILAHWTIGHPAFEGVGPMQALAIGAGRRRPAIYPHALAGVIESGLLANPDERPELYEWRDALARSRE